MKERVSESVVDRIMKMEYCFDEVREALYNRNTAISHEQFREKVEALIDYYDSGQWLEDYECDERGELPLKLKRGVLSQDGIYNLLADIASDYDFMKDNEV